METAFFILILLVAVVWLAVRSSRAAEEIDRLSDRLFVLEQHLRQLQEWVDALRKPSIPAEPPPAVAPEPTTLAQLLKQREEAKPASLPAQPPASVAGAPVLAREGGTAPGPTPLVPLLVPPRIDPLPQPANAGVRAPIPPIPPPPPPKPALKIDWEQFMGVKLIAWIGGCFFYFGVELLSL